MIKYDDKCGDFHLRGWRLGESSTSPSDTQYITSFICMMTSYNDRHQRAYVFEVEIGKKHEAFSFICTNLFFFKTVKCC